MILNVNNDVILLEKETAELQDDLCFFHDVDDCVKRRTGFFFLHKILKSKTRFYNFNTIKNQKS